MPYHIYRFIHGKIRICFRLKISLIICGIRTAYLFFLNIADITVISRYLIPVLSFIQKPKDRIFRDFCKNFRLNPSAIPDYCIFLYSYCLYIAKFILYRHPCRVFIYIGINICILFYIIQFQINCVIFQPYISVCLL